MKNLRRNSSFRYRAQAWNKNRQYSVPRQVGNGHCFCLCSFLDRIGMVFKSGGGNYTGITKRKSPCRKMKKLCKKVLTSAGKHGIITKLSDADGARQKGFEKPKKGVDKAPELW